MHLYYTCMAVFYYYTYNTAKTSYNVLHMHDMYHTCNTHVARFQVQIGWVSELISQLICHIITQSGLVTSVSELISQLICHSISQSGLVTSVSQLISQLICHIITQSGLVASVSGLISQLIHHVIGQSVLLSWVSWSNY